MHTRGSRRMFLVVTVLFLLDASAARAQVVQLPTYRVFSVGTTVSVPDRGTAYLGGVTRGAWSSSSRGVPGLSQVPGLNRLFTNRSIASSLSSSQASVTATIIDHAEWDRQLLAEAAASRGELPARRETDRRAAFLSEFTARRVAEPRAGVGSPEREPVADVAERVARAEAEQRDEMAAYLQRAEAAAAAGRMGAARCCYDVLLRRGSAEQRRLAAQRLAALREPPADDRLVSRDP